jgi:Carboxypeptidase regulatory-like domain
MALQLERGARRLPLCRHGPGRRRSSSASELVPRQTVTKSSPQPIPLAAQFKSHVGTAQSRLFTACLFALACALASSSARAQAVYGSIAGTVFDSSGAPIPHATVTVTSVERNTSSSVTTNESGNYAQTHLIIGHYSVRVEAGGFNVEVQEGVELAIDTVTAVDFHLKPGKVQETVEITGEAPLLKTERTDVATTYPLKLRSVRAVHGL